MRGKVDPITDKKIEERTINSIQEKRVKRARPSKREEKAIIKSLGLNLRVVNQISQDSVLPSLEAPAIQAQNPPAIQIQKPPSAVRARV